MRTPNLGTVVFNPADPPADPKELQRYLRELNGLLGACIGALAAGHLDQTHVAPAKPRDGDIRYAAGGAAWDPGSGKGLYMHNGSVWTLVKAIP
jgi:hypothetical protein